MSDKNPHGVAPGQWWQSNDIRLGRFPDEPDYQAAPFRVVDVNEETGRVTVDNGEAKPKRTLKLDNFGIKAKKGYTRTDA